VVFGLSQLLLEKKKRKPKWFIELVEEIRKLIGKEKKVRKMLIETRHAIGKKILEAKLQPDFFEIFESVPKYMKALSDELGISEAELYAYEKLAEKFPDLQKLYEIHPDTELSWHAIEHEILYPRKPVEKEQQTIIEKMEKMCQLEKDINQLLLLLIPKRAENLKCDECPIQQWCSKARPKILTVGSELADLQA